MFVPNRVIKSNQLSTLDEYKMLHLFLQSKLFDHDNMNLKKLLDELESVMDQVETELQRRAEETPGICEHL